MTPPLALRLNFVSHPLVVATGKPCNVPTAQQANGHFTVSPKVSDVFPGSDVTYQCEDGYETSDSKTAKCQTNGRYEYPTCTCAKPCRAEKPDQTNCAQKSCAATDCPAGECYEGGCPAACRTGYHGDSATYTVRDIPGRLSALSGL